MKRVIYTAAVAVALVFTAPNGNAQNKNWIKHPAELDTEGGYVNSMSISKGETLKFFISTINPTFDLDIYKLGDKKVKVLTLTSVKGGFQSVPDSAYANGCAWKSTAEILITDDWKSGVYEADFPISSGYEKLIFIVREKVLGSYSNTVVCLTLNTWQAYNNWGGKSLYPFNSTDGISTPKVSFERPFYDINSSSYFTWTDKLVDWLDRENRPVEYCTNIDLDRDPTFLDHYTTYVTVGHDEYWSRPERNACQRLVDRCGKMIVLSGNTCWWQVRYDTSSRTITCYKNPTADPLYGKQDSIVTTVWSWEPVNDPENVLLGTTFAHGGYVNSGNAYPLSKGYGGYTAFHTSNWIYNNTGVRDGDIIGQYDPIAGYEVDGSLIQFGKNGDLQISGFDKTPRSFSVLGMTAAADDSGAQIGVGTMGYYSKSSGGAVFNAATTDWVKGLQWDSTVIKMTENIFHQFCDKTSLPPVISDFYPSSFTIDSINHQKINVRHRKILLRYDKADTLMVNSWDPLGKKLKFRWSINDKTIGTDSVLILPASMKQSFSQTLFVTVTVSNQTDSISAGWWFIDSSIRFITAVPTKSVMQHKWYSFTPDAVSLSDERPKFTILSGPKWLRSGWNGVLSGIADTNVGTYNVTLQALDNRGHSTIQKFQIEVKDSLANVQQSKKLITNIVNAPNPFASKTEIRFTLKDEARISVEITDLNGLRIQSLASEQFFGQGLNSLDWNGTNENGIPVASGVYLCRTTIEDANGISDVLTQKIIKL